MKKQMKGAGFYLIAAIVICAIIYMFTQYNATDNKYTYGDFISDLNKGKIEQVTIKQNKEVPTGRVIAEFKDGSKKTIEDHICGKYINCHERPSGCRC
ncbi:ATP-dependent metallopeptidase FtsH/Yme1/Tma family protein [Lachnospiraceae bacterium HCP1S3_B12]